LQNPAHDNNCSQTTATTTTTTRDYPPQTKTTSAAATRVECIKQIVAKTNAVVFHIMPIVFYVLKCNRREKCFSKIIIFMNKKTLKTTERTTAVSKNKEVTLSMH